MQSESSSLNYLEDLSRGDVIARLVSAIGRKLTAYIGSARDVREIDRWLADNDINAD